MSTLRIFLAWLVLAALPLQGFAAATMLFCGQVRSPSGQSVSGHPHAVAEATGHDHGVHDHGAANPHASDGDEGGPAQDDPADAGHACAVCAACSNVVALVDYQPPLPVTASPGADLPQPAVRILARASPRPDKPPRA